MIPDFERKSIKIIINNVFEKWWIFTTGILKNIIWMSQFQIWLAYIRYIDISIEREEKNEPSKLFGWKNCTHINICNWIFQPLYAKLGAIKYQWVWCVSMQCVLGYDWSKTHSRNWKKRENICICLYKLKSNFLRIDSWLDSCDIQRFSPDDDDMMIYPFQVISFCNLHFYFVYWNSWIWWSSKQI